MARRYLVDPLPGPGPAELPEDISHHVSRVLRAAPGDSITLFDGRGQICSAVLVRCTGHRVHVETGEHRPGEAEPVPRIHLAVALPKGARADSLFEQATVLGIHAIHPVVSTRSENRHSRLPRWRRIAAAAAGQCDRDFLPEITEPQPLSEFLTMGDLPQERYVAHRPAPALDRAEGTAVVLLIGPEGGLTEEEAAAACDHGFRPRSLGRLVLRTETAALAGAVLLGCVHGTG